MTTSSTPSAALLAEVEADAAAEPADKLDALRAECERLRGDDLEIADLTARLEEVGARRKRRAEEIIPDLMDKARVPAIELAAAGNHPAVRVSVEPYYHASIAADWPPEKRRAAFDWLDANDSGDLIKTVVTARFNREDRESALKAVAALRASGVEGVEVGEAVHFATLTKWLKERHAAELPLPPLDVIGAHIGRVAKVKPLKEKK